MVKLNGITKKVCRMNSTWWYYNSNSFAISSKISDIYISPFQHSHTYNTHTHIISEFLNGKSEMSTKKPKWECYHWHLFVLFLLEISVANVSQNHLIYWNKPFKKEKKKMFQLYKCALRKTNLGAISNKTLHPHAYFTLFVHASISHLSFQMRSAILSL